MTEVARQLRGESTSSEDVLWQALRDRQLDGRKFRRQRPVGVFVLDFYCAEERLAVEIDGPVHETQREADRARQEMLETLGIRFVRIAAAQVENDLPGVLEVIRAAFSPHPCRPAVGVPSPTRGEGTSGQSSAATPPRPGVGEGAGG